MNEIVPVLFGVLMCSVFFWFYLCHRMFGILRTRHPEKYEAMGKPTLIMNNSISNNLSFIKFLFKREWRALDDGALENLGNGMLVFVVFYTVLFVSLFLGVLLGGAS